MTTALITGIGGFVGSHLAEYLLAHTDWDIVGTFRWNEPQDNLQELVGNINRADRVKLVHADLTDAWSLVRLVQDDPPDFVFHLAAQSYVMASLSGPIETLTANAIGTGNLLEALRQWAPEAWVHVCSSSEVYGKVERSYGGITEQTPFEPASPYSISKVTTDLLAQYYAKAYGLRIMVTRMFTHTGPRRGDVFMESSFAKQIAMIEAGQMKPPIKVGNLEAVRTIADVRDAVRAYYLLLTHDPQPGEVYNIGGDYTCTATKVLVTLLSLSTVKFLDMDTAITIDPARLRPIDADHQIPDCSKFKRHAGWGPEIPFEQTMQDLLDWWRWKVKHGTPLQR